jgi:hypothetical protein
MHLDGKTRLMLSKRICKYMRSRLWLQKFSAHFDIDKASTAAYDEFHQLQHKRHAKHHTLHVKHYM